MLTEKEARRIVDRVRELSQADEVFIDLSESQTSHLRFARNTPSTSGTYGSVTLGVRSTFGTRSASARVNQLDDATLTAVVRRSEELARLAPKDPEHMPVLGAQSYPTLPTPPPWSRQRTSERMAEGSATCIAGAAAQDVVAAGFSRASTARSFVGTSAGLFAMHDSAAASFSETVRTRDATGSGWAAAVGNAMDDIDYAAQSSVAIDKALRSRTPRPLEPGKYVAILEPTCVAAMAQLLIYGMGARSADEGRSFFSAPGGGNRLGEALLPDGITIRSDPSSSLAPGSPWGADGVPQRPLAWIDKGRVAQLHCDRYWAHKTHRDPVPPPSNVLMAGGSGTLHDLIASTKRGVLITSLWYIRGVDPQTMLHTGLTRDGVFWIENGEIRYPVTNFRWNESPVRVFKNVDALSASVRACPRESDANTIVVPAMRVNEFELTSVSEAV